MVTHGKQRNDAIIQTTLKQIRFDIDLTDESSIDRIALNIRNTLTRDFPSKIHTHYELQRVMQKPSMTTLLESNPTDDEKDDEICDIMTEYVLFAMIANNT